MKNIVPIAVAARCGTGGGVDGVDGVDNVDGIDCDLLALGCFQGETADTAGLGGAWSAAAALAASRPGWQGGEGQVAETGLENGGGAVLALYGLGPAGDLTWRRLAAWLVRVADAARVNGAVRLGFLLPRHRETTGAGAAERIARVLALADYRFDRFLSTDSTATPRLPRLERVVILPPPGEEATFAAAVERMLPVAAATALSRDLANAPANEATPAWLEERAAELARERGIGFTVLDREELARRRMGGLLAVGSGAVQPPRLLRLEVGSTGPVVALVGKGVTFDSGGISIKTGGDLDEMKYDKCGACSMLAVAWAVAGLALPLRLRVYLPIAENMLDSRSYRPGDIVRFANGKTVEITNTDAEGRLILADAMTLASEEGAEILLEYSTLTGACVVALGHHAAGFYTPDDELAAALKAAAERSGERLWRLPLWPEYLEEMKGMHADLRNSAGRGGAANTAAAFLSQFVGGLTRWAHLDIAGVAHVSRDQNGHPGATGYGIALTLDYLRRLAGA
jgi:leucyl aminopeptidase